MLHAYIQYLQDDKTRTTFHASDMYLSMTRPMISSPNASMWVVLNKRSKLENRPRLYASLGETKMPLKLKRPRVNGSDQLEYPDSGSLKNISSRLSWSHTAASNVRLLSECNGAGGMVVINGTIDIDSRCRYCNLDKGLQLEKRHPNASISPLVPLQLELSYPKASVSVSLPVVVPLNHTERRLGQFENASVASRVQPLSPPVLPFDSSHCIIDMLDGILTDIHVDSLLESGTRARNQLFLREESLNQSLRAAFDLRPDLLGENFLLEEDHGDKLLGKVFRSTRGRIDRMLRKLKTVPMEKHIEALIKKASICMAATSGVHIHG
jgi:hypothetical protein